ncbi:MAG: phosphotransferase [candidate division Zixibacteria bacterium]|nr:phosphotransferase [candidate division Zixibacteria bacterium]
MFQLMKKYVESYVCQNNQWQIEPEKTIYLDSSNGMIGGGCCLFFGKDKNFPLLVAKGASRLEGKVLFETEFDTLQNLERIGMNTERRTTPMPLKLWREEGNLITLQAALPGTLMISIPARTLFSQNRISTTIARVVDWWRHFQELAGVRKIQLTDKTYEKEILLPLLQFKQRFRMDKDEILFLTRRYFEERPLFGIELPFMVRHCDFFPGNMVYGPEGIGVFDWEFPLDHHLPFFDLFYFFSSVRFPFNGYRGESSHFDSFISVFWGNNYFNKAMRHCIQQMCAVFEIPGECVLDLFLLSLIQVANMKYETLIKGHGINEELLIQTQISEEEKRLLWQSLWIRKKDNPFAFIRDGVFENIRFIVRNGLPNLANS